MNYTHNMQRCLICSFLLLICISAFKSYAQTPVLKVDFENQNEIHTASGIIGKAFDLGDVARRKGLTIPNPLKGANNLTIALWVKGDTQGSSSYDILTGVTTSEKSTNVWKDRIINGKVHSDKNYLGWKIGMQSNGAWQYTVRSENYMYEYSPMPFRQNIRDGSWHMLAVSFDKQVKELRFYYDGMQKAIYNIDRLGEMVMADSIMIGNSAENNYDITKGRDWDSFYGQIDDVSLYDRVLSGDQIADYYQKVSGKNLNYNTDNQGTLKVTAFNIYNGGSITGKEIGKNRIIDLMKRDDADIFTLVETYGSGEEIADALGYELYLISSNLSILSRYPITKTYQIFKPFNSGGAQIALSEQQKINVLSVWLAYLPVSRDVFSKPGANVRAFLEEESKTRGLQMSTILQEIQPQLAETDKVPLIIAGDFNSGSHLDWIKATASTHNNYVVPFVPGIILAKAGLIDSYRKMHPDPVKFPGITSSPFFPGHQKNRIDYVYYKGKTLEVLNSTTIEHHPLRFPSDHAAVSTLFKLNPAL